jgi:hypothetical protein
MTTAQEIEFLDRLGSHAEGHPYRLERATRPELLNLYLYAARRRYRWGGIDRHVVEQHANALLYEAVIGLP